MKSVLPLSTLVAAGLLSACAGTPTAPAQLLSARSAVDSAAADPQVLSHAPVELKKAGDALDKANRLLAKGESLAEVESVAYVAQRQAETARAVAAAKGKEEAIKSAEAERERARADARAAEASRAQAQAASARAEAIRAQAQAANARADASSAQAQAANARADASSARMEASSAQQQADAARMQAAAAQASASNAQLQAATLQAQLAELQARQTDRGMLVTLGDLLFEFGRAEVKPSAQEALRKLAAYLQQHPERRILIEGYTDSVGSDSANQLLSLRRAEAVATELAGLGVARDRISARGYGESYPIADNTTDTNRAMNRRVEVYISDNDQPVRGRG